MAPQAPTANDIILLKLLVQAGGSLTSKGVEASIQLFDTRMKMASGPGRYFLEKARYHGWATPEAKGDLGARRVTYHITEAGREAHDRYVQEDRPPLSMNGGTVIPAE